MRIRKERLMARCVKSAFDAANKNLTERAAPLALLIHLPLLPKQLVFLVSAAVSPALPQVKYVPEVLLRAYP